MTDRRIKIIGELMNNSYARARNAFTDRDLAGYQNLAKLQSDLGVEFLTLNIDGTQRIEVQMEEMLAFLPDLISAVQEVCSTPISFDNPAVEYHKVALKHYDRSKGGAPILNSLSASRQDLDEMVELVQEYDTYVIVMASEMFADGRSLPCLHPDDSYATAKQFVDLLREKAGRRNDQILIDTGLAPIGADIDGFVNIGLDAMRLIKDDPDLDGVHLMVGLSNFAYGTRKGAREELEKAYLTLAQEVGLDFALANPEKSPLPLPAGHPMVGKLRAALAAGRPLDGESQKDAGYRQLEAIMEICSDF